MWICTVHHFYSNSEAMPQRQLLLSYLHRRKHAPDALPLRAPVRRRRSHRQTPDLTCIRCKHAPNDALPLPYVGAHLTARHQTTLSNYTYGPVYHVVCRFTPPAFAEYSLRLHTEGWLRLSRPGCLVLHQSGLPVLRNSPMLALTIIQASRKLSIIIAHSKTPNGLRHFKEHFKLYCIEERGIGIGILGLNIPLGT